jgi:hypothetical protein
MQPPSETETAFSPLDDLTYDLVTLLHEKAKALEAYEKYIEDAEIDEEARMVLQELQRQDVDAVRRLRELAARYLASNDLDLTSEDDDEDLEVTGVHRMPGTDSTAPRTR